MNSIKVGQIYKTAHVIRVVKRIIKPDLVEFIYKGYKKTSLSKTDFYNIWRESLIAEYPTAVPISNMFFGWFFWQKSIKKSQPSSLMTGM